MPQICTHPFYIVPPVILSFPSLSGQIFTNEPVTLTVNFKSHTQEITSVRWFKNDVRITSDDINTTYGASPNATTQLEFTQIARQNRGTYRVEIENSADVIPSNMRTVATTFNVNVQGRYSTLNWCKGRHVIPGKGRQHAPTHCTCIHIHTR